MDQQVIAETVSNFAFWVTVIGTVATVVAAGLSIAFFWLSIKTQRSSDLTLAEIQRMAAVIEERTGQNYQQLMDSALKTGSDRAEEAVSAAEDPEMKQILQTNFDEVLRAIAASASQPPYGIQYTGALARALDTGKKGQSVMGSLLDPYPSQPGQEK